MFKLRVALSIRYTANFDTMRLWKWVCESKEQGQCKGLEAPRLKESDRERGRLLELGEIPVSQKS